MFLSFQKITQALRNVSAVVSDVYFNLVTLLVNTTSTNGAQNNTFLDSSSNAFDVTRNGNMTQGTFTPFSQTGWSNYISTANGYVKMPVRAAYGVGTGNFTLEGFFTVDGRGTRKPFTVGNVTAESIAVTFTNTNLRIDIAGTTSIIDTAYAVPLNNWNHIAFVRSGTGTGQVNLYVNGAYVANGTSSGSVVASDVQYGGIDWTGGFGLVGFYSNFRYSNVARYSGATYTVPTAPFTTDANTLALAAQSNIFVNNSSLGGSLTVSAASVQAFSPFAPTTAYSTTTVGGSGYFDGSGDYLSFPVANATLLPGTGQFTFELWFYCTGTAFQTLFSYGATSGMLRVFIQDGGLQIWNGSSQFTAGTLTLIKYGGWNHVVVERNATNLISYVNGTRDYNAVNSTNFNNGSLEVGSESGGSLITGYISGFSYIKGNATYTGTTITVPTAPPSTSNTTACLLFTNAGIFDSAAKNDLRTVGNASVSTAQTKFGTSSMFFDGAGDYVSAAPVNIINAVNNANCTIEMWVYSSNSSASLKCLVDTRTGLSNSTGYGIYQIANNVVIFGGGLRGNAVASLTGNTWTHVAVTRANVTNYVFIGGTLYNTFTYGNTLSSGNVTIGADVAGSNAFTGYIDEVRITDGFARYTANFTPTTTAFPTQ